MQSAARGATGRAARLAARHHLAPDSAGTSVLDVAADLVGFHGTDPTSVYLAAWARVRDFRVADLERALYEDRSLLKILGMRRTMFVVPVELAGVIQAACSDKIAARERGRLHGMLAGAGITDDPVRWLAAVEEETLDALRRLGEATASDLAREVAGLRQQITYGWSQQVQGTVGVSTRLLFLLSAEGRVIRGRPKGTLVSSLYRWTSMDRWVPGGLPLMPKAEAQAELVRRYLATYGPATLVDVKWWTGWTVAESRKALAAAGAREVDLADGKRGWTLPDRETSSADSTRPADSWVAFLPALDATTMGWQERGWFLDPHRPRLFDRNGNAGPTIWLDGRVVGGWIQRRNGEIVYELLEDVGADVTGLVESKAADLRDWLGDLRFVPRFRTPLEQELSA
jgi:winged helix DNA-binding protein